MGGSFQMQLKDFRIRTTKSSVMQNQNKKQQKQPVSSQPHGEKSAWNVRQKSLCPVLKETKPHINISLNSLPTTCPRHIYCLSRDASHNCRATLKFAAFTSPISGLLLAVAIYMWYGKIKPWRWHANAWMTGNTAYRYRYIHTVR